MSQNPTHQNLSLVPVDNSHTNEGNSTDSDGSRPSQSNGISPNVSAQGYSSQTLQDLLNLSTSLRRANNYDDTEEVAPEKITPERAEFLKKVLNDMSADYASEMQKRIEILKEIQTKPEDVIEANLTKYEDTLEQLVEYLYEIDLAQVFYQIGGLNVITPLLQSKYPTLRTLTASIILECCKNNPFCQQQSVREVFGPLMKMASSDLNKDAMFKAIASVSAIIRDNPAGIEQFNHYNGLEMVEKALNCGCEKIVNKAIFLIMALCDTDSAMKEKLTERGIVQTLVTLLLLSDNIVKEYVLRALLSITPENQTAEKICRESNLQNYLIKLCQKTEDYDNLDDSTLEMRDCAATLYKQLFGELPVKSNTVIGSAS